MSTPEAKCATCQHIGRKYWDNGFTISHHCKKGDVRRAETMSPSADLFDHFRAFFDASADQKACRHYEERPLASAEVLALLNAMGETGRAELKFWSRESSLASDLDGKFVEKDWHAESQKGYRVFRLLPVGKAERERAAAGERDHG